MRSAPPRVRMTSTPASPPPPDPATFTRNLEPKVDPRSVSKTMNYEF